MLLDDDQLSRLRDQIKLHEGLSLTMYKCTAGKNTIGYGRNVDDNPLTDEENEYLGNKDIFAEGITLDEANYLLDKEIEECIEKLTKRLPGFTQLDPIRMRVIIDLSFNMGVPGLLKFKNTLAALARLDYEATANGLKNSLWYKQVGTRAVRLVKMMKTGEDYTE
ncbi:MAG: hypothetical protein H7836_13125 [Magnetococcus sp. YQC-3]